MVHSALVSRQIWATPTKTVTPASIVASQTQTQSALCTIALPIGGVLRFNDTYATVLNDSITFESSCEDHAIQGCSNDGNSTVVNVSDPFYASVAPQIYALATATIISYLLVILIFITPRTFYVGGPGGGANFLGLRSLVPGSGSSSAIGVGRRPLLQKIAAVTVAISLTIATADTFRVADGQYRDGLMDSEALVEDVIDSLEIRVVRVISDTFLWLAQVQTLIRLFPRHKEKVTIKWLGFALVLCDTVFSILENFISQATLTRPRSFQDAIPALSYLFQMAISLIYASCVIYYSLSKRRFAFWHPKMRNILLVALLSLASVLTPVVFFVLDVSQPSIATWGEYMRWVGSAAASVVVWEWVERIEALERDERRDGILGREVFDGDEMLVMGPDDKSSSAANYFGFGMWSSLDGDKKVSMFPMRNIRPRVPFQRKKADRKSARQNARHNFSTINTGTDGNDMITRPPQIVTPVSRSDTTSAASTLYAVRYQNVSSPSPAIPEEPQAVGPRSRHPSVQINGQSFGTEEAGSPTMAKRADNDALDTQVKNQGSMRYGDKPRQRWQAVANPFKRKRAEPPAEVAAQSTAFSSRRSPAQTYHNLRERLNAARSLHRDRAGGGEHAGPSPPMPVTVIPAQPRSSHLVVPDEALSTSQHSSTHASEQSRKSSSFRSRRESLSVTVIPAPVRGGRTWSPDDLKHEGVSSTHQESLTGHKVSETAQRITHTPGGQDDGDIYVARGALTIAESPARVRQHDSRTSPGMHRSSISFEHPR